MTQTADLPTESWHAPSRPAAGDRVTQWAKTAYGAGGLTDYFFLNIPLALAQWIYVIALGMKPQYLGITLAIPKVVGAFCDPIIGPVSDNTRSRLGRRRPYILCGGLLGGLLLPLVWMPPGRSQWELAAWAVLMMSGFSVLYSIFTIPYTALGYELSSDYDERTSVLAWRSSIQLGGVLLVAWAYWICLRPVFGNEIAGARWLSTGVGLIMIGGALWTVFSSRERVQYRQQAKLNPLAALRISLSNRAFLILQASLLIVTFGQGVTSIIGGYLHLYYACQGSKDLASRIAAIGGTVATALQFFGLPLGLWVSKHTGKCEGAVVGLAILGIGILSLPWTLNSAHPWFIIIAWLVCNLGVQCFSLMFSSMTADVCDEDELQTGMRREGAYSAAASLLGRGRDIIMLLSAGVLPFVAGYVDSTRIPSAGQLHHMKQLMISLQLATVAMAIATVCFFPISRARSARTRRELEQRAKK